MGQAERRPPASPTMGSGSNSGVVISTSRSWLRMVVPQTGQSFNSSTMNFSKRTRVTIREVAAHAGVSIATVSNVLNGKAQRATPETVARIQEAVAALGYRKDVNAAALKTGKSNTVWVLMPRTPGADPLHDGALDSPFFNDFLSGIERGASAGHQLINFCRISQLDDLAPIQYGPQPTGVIVMGRYDDEISAAIRAWDFPTVIIDNPDFFAAATSANHLNYTIDDRQMGELAANHLLDLGHRQILLLFGGLALSPVHQARYDGAVNACRARGGDCRLVEADVSAEGGRRAFAQIATAINEGVTAVIAMADVLAIGCYQAATDAGLRIPEQFSLVGMDNLRLLEYLPFQLTTVSQQIIARGFHAVQTLAEGQPLPDLPLQLIAGNTSAAR